VREQDKERKGEREMGERKGGVEKKKKFASIN